MKLSRVFLSSFMMVLLLVSCSSEKSPPPIKPSSLRGPLKETLAKMNNLAQQQAVMIAQGQKDGSDIGTILLSLLLEYKTALRGPELFDPRYMAMFWWQAMMSTRTFMPLLRQMPLERQAMVLANTVKSLRGVQGQLGVPGNVMSQFNSSLAQSQSILGSPSVKPYGGEAVPPVGSFGSSTLGTGGLLGQQPG